MIPARRRTAAALLCVFALAAPGVARAQGAATPTVSAQETAAIKVQQTGDWSQALIAFDALAKAEPQNPRAAFGLGAALHETGKPAEAIVALTRARTLGYQPANQVRFRLARAYAKVGD